MTRCVGTRVYMITGKYVNIDIRQGARLDASRAVNTMKYWGQNDFNLQMTLLTSLLLKYTSIPLNLNYLFNMPACLDLPINHEWTFLFLDCLIAVQHIHNIMIFILTLPSSALFVHPLVTFKEKDLLSRK